jgi:hypothetical protein
MKSPHKEIYLANKSKGLGGITGLQTSKIIEIKVNK